MRKLYIFYLLISFLSINYVQAQDLEINSSNVLMYNLNDDTILYEINKDEKVSIASMTKIMTALVAIENIESLDQKVILNFADFEGLAEANASVAGFYVGQTLTYRDLLYGLMLPSGADAALALTRNIAGSEENFVQLMNNKASELKLSNTNFTNSTGLDDENHYSTLADVAIIFKYALQNQEFKTIISTDTYRTSDNYLSLTSTIEKNLKRYGLEMEYLIGGKTGTTNDAGLCLASIATYNNVDYMLITAGAAYNTGRPHHLLDAQTLYEYFMNNYSYQEVLNPKDKILTLDTQYAKKESVDFYAQQELFKYLENDFQKSNLTYKYEGLKIVTPDMEKGTFLGKVFVYNDSDLLTVIDVTLEEEQEFDIKEYYAAYRYEIITISVIALTSVIVIIVVVKKYRKKRNY